MGLLWNELRAAVPLIVNGDPTLMSVIGFTLQVAAVATAVAVVLGLPAGLALGLGRFRGRGVLRLMANASMGMPPVLVGTLLFLLFVPQGPLGALHLNTTRTGVMVAQSVLALPYTVALTAAAVQSLAPGLPAQARLLGAGRLQVAGLALREARIGVMAGVVAALAASLSEVAAIVIVGGNAYGYDQTLASAALYETNAALYARAVAVGIVLLALIVVLVGGLSLLGQRSGGLPWRAGARRPGATRAGATVAP
jgi:tungstate transport system permease protein